MRRRTVLTPPEVKDTYGDWTVYGQPLPKLVKNNGSASNRWFVPVQCSCGTKDLIDFQNLKKGRSTRCYKCAMDSAKTQLPKRLNLNATEVKAFGETKTIQEWAEDSRCCVSEAVLRNRIRCSGINNESAMQEPLWTIRTRSKITEGQAREIMLKAFHGHQGIDLSKEYGLSTSQITQLVHGNTYEWATRELMAQLIDQCWGDKQIFLASCYGRGKFPSLGAKFGCWTIIDKPHSTMVKGFKEWLMPAKCECGNKAQIKKFCGNKGSVKCQKCGSTGILEFK